MVLRDSLIYLGGRLFPGAVSVLSVALFSRWMGAAEYGGFALIVAAASFASTTGYQWLRLSLLRQLSASAQAERSSNIGNSKAVFFATTIAVLIVGGVASIIFPASVTSILAATVLTVAQSWFNLVTEALRALGLPTHWSLANIVRALLALGAGALAVTISGTSVSLALAQSVAFAFAAWAIGAVVVLWRGARPRWPDREQLWAMLSYGLPLAASFAVAFVVSGSDRLIIGWLMGTESVGTYSVAYDFSFQPLSAMFAFVGIATQPLVFRKLSERDEEGAQALLSNHSLYLGAAVIASCGILCASSDELSELFLAPEFREDASSLMPWVAGAVGLFAIRVHYFDMAFQIARKTSSQLLSTLVAAIVNAIANLLLIPIYGLLGAAIATVAAYAAGLACSIRLGRKHFHLPSLRPLTPLAVATAVLVVLCRTRVLAASPATRLVAECVLVCAPGVAFVIWTSVSGHRTAAHE